ncbi:hypothetical protein TRM7615_00260 [Falsiruegeria mediterranea M17]|uniref:Uncharacterized protein n=1 Tax=Falsiruegeria mediterranea M17 TaxID=1200281 RepID=A0A2R8C2X9_9RHOB|nr:hypothetical protein TRM7615_00260 [Falsiruegeria mediterranea M17]
MPARARSNLSRPEAIAPSVPMASFELRIRAMRSMTWGCSTAMISSAFADPNPSKDIMTNAVNVRWVGVTRLDT